MDDKGNQSKPTASTTMSHPGSQSSPGPSQQPRRFEESWIEVSSQPSSSSLSSVGDEIVTTGLRVGSGPRRRRRLPAPARSFPQQQTTIRTTSTSSQEEYDESESEDDQVLTSSTENMRSSPDEAMDDSDAESDDGDNATALGRVSDQPEFHPQPNAFSHPPSHVAHRSNSSGAAIPSHPHGNFTRPSFTQRSQTRVHRSGPSFMSPAAREDNDAALRASLTTLLSCAAAARGLPKSRETEERRAGSNGVGPSDQPVELRFVPESDLPGDTATRQPAAPPSDKKAGSSNRSSARSASADKSKRSGSATRSPRAAKKKRTMAAMADDATLISPTLLTWVVSAGVVVLVSVVGFGAGYVIGREVGRQEVMSASVGSVNETSSAGREVIRTSSGSLRRFKWGSVGRSIVSQA